MVNVLILCEEALVSTNDVKDSTSISKRNTLPMVAKFARGAVNKYCSNIVVKLFDEVVIEKSNPICQRKTGKVLAGVIERNGSTPRKEPSNRKKLKGAEQTTAAIENFSSVANAGNILNNQVNKVLFNGSFGARISFKRQVAMVTVAQKKVVDCGIHNILESELPADKLRVEEAMEGIQTCEAVNACLDNNKE